MEMCNYTMITSIEEVKAVILLTKPRDELPAAPERIQRQVLVEATATAVSLFAAT